MAVVVSPHDKCFKLAMSNSQVAQDFFNHHLPLKVKSLIDLHSLSLQRESFIDQQLKLSLSDLLFTANFMGRTGYLYLLVEHQSRPDKLMPFRLLNYLCSIAKQHLSRTQGTVLPSMYPMVFYHGQEAYAHSLDLFDLFEDDAEFMREVLFQPFQLIDVSQLPDEQLKQHPWAGAFELLMKHIFVKDLLLEFEEIVRLLRKVERAGGREYVVGLLEYTLVAGNLSSLQEFVDVVHQGLSPDIKEEAMTIAEQLELRGKEIGKKEGIREGKIAGKREEKREIACNLLQAGSDERFVAKMTNLSLEEIQQLKVSALFNS